MREMLIALYGRSRSLTCPAAASSSAILRRYRRWPVTGLARRNRLAIATASSSLATAPSFLASRARSILVLRPSHQPASCHYPTLAPRDFSPRLIQTDRRHSVRGAVLEIGRESGRERVGSA